MNHLLPYNLFEKAIPLDDILKEETQQGLLVRDKKVVNALERWVVLYDFDDKEVLAYMSMKKWNGDNYWEQMMTAAVKNYGPDIYDISLMATYPEPIRPSTTIKQEALGVWKYYSDHRSDVKRKEFPKDDKAFAKKYEFDMEKENKNRTDKEGLDVINTLYYLKPVPDFNKLMERGKEYIKKYKVNSANIFDEADKYFWKRYYKEAA